MHKSSCSGMCAVSKALLIIGGINWGLVGVGGFAGGNWNIVNLLLGSWPMAEWVVYILVGLAAIKTLAAMCMCKGGSC